VTKGCGDLIFSSHVSFAMTFVMCLQTYLHKFIDLKSFRLVMYAVYWPLMVLQSLFIIAARKHYTVDIVVAWYTVPFVWNLTFALCSDFETDFEPLPVSSSEPDVLLSNV